MKKLLVFAIVAIVGTMANAASVNWGGAIAAQDDPSGSADAGTVAYLFWSSTDVGTAAGGNLNIDGDNYTLKNAGGNTLEATMVQRYELSATELSDGAFTATYTKNGSDVNGYYNVVIVNGGDGQFADYYTSISGTTAQSSPTDIQLNPEWDDAGAFFGDSSSGMGYSGTVGGGGDIPEPTSGLLLLIGGSLLALRRKHK